MHPFEPGELLFVGDRSFVYFRAAGTEDFYYVLMAPRAPEDVVAELPRPLPGTTGIDYFVRFYRASDVDALARGEERWR